MPLQSRAKQAGPPPPPPPFANKDQVVDAVLSFYRDPTNQVLGPRDAVRQAIDQPGFLQRIPQTVIVELVREALTVETEKHSTNGHSLNYRQKWSPASGTMVVTVTQVGTSPRQVVVPVTRPPYAGPTVVVPTILVHTTFVTAEGPKPLIRFTRADFAFCIERYQAQQDGLERRVDAMQAGDELLRLHRSQTVAELPAPVIERFSAAWEDAINPKYATPGRP